MTEKIAISVIAVVSLLLTANLIFFVSKKLKLPYSVLLVLTGAGIYPFKDNFSILENLELNPQLLFFVFLPLLLFESAFNIDFRKLSKDLDLVTYLATFGVILSTIIIGFGASFVLQIPLEVAFLFAAVISSTDPIAVISIFKELGVPKRLIQLVDSESMFNDATSLILSDIIKPFLVASFVSGSMLQTVGDNLLFGFENFIYIALTSLIVGSVIGLTASKLVEIIRNELFIEFTITIAAAYLAFIFTEEVLDSSGIIATVTVGVIIGNYGKHKFSPKVKHLLKEFWEYLSFISNSLVFLLVGLTFGLSIVLSNWQQAILISLLAFLGRAVAVYFIGFLHNRFNPSRALPIKWLHVMWWGGLRGALPIAVIMYYAEQAVLEGDAGFIIYEESLLRQVVSVVFWSLILGGITIRPLIRLLKVDRVDTRQKVESILIQTLVLNKSIKHIKNLEKIGEISGKHRLLNKNFVQDFRNSVKKLQKLFEKYPLECKTAIYSYAFYIEQEVFTKLNEKTIISSKILYRLENKLLYGLELIDQGIFPVDFSSHDGMKNLSQKYRKDMTLQEAYVYRKAREFANLEVLGQMETFNNIPALKNFIGPIMLDYRKFYQKNRKVCSFLEEENSLEILEFEKKLCYQEFLATEENILEELKMNGKISTQVLQDLYQTMFKA